jgi:hypothetical protein
MTLAYVFWHWPAQREGYEERIQAFHAALESKDTATFKLERAPFDDAEPPFEDWYPVPDWTAVGELNARAVGGPRKAPHDAVAQMSRKGTGAIYKQIWGELPLREVEFAAWTPHRPEPRHWHATIWQRQLVLGPAPEYAVLAASPVDVGSGGGVEPVLTRPRLVAAGA